MITSYSPRALLEWFGVLTPRWEERFPKSVVEKGRLLYKTDIFERFELDERTLRLTAKVEGGHKVVSIVKDGKGGLSFPDSESEHCILVGGLYLLEELIAETMVPIGKEELPPIPVVAPSPAAQPVSVRLRFSITPEGIVACPDLSSNAEARAKREATIRLLHRAQKNGFQKRADGSFFRPLENLTHGNSPWDWGLHVIVEKPLQCDWILPESLPLTVKVEIKQAEHSGVCYSTALVGASRSGNIKVLDDAEIAYCQKQGQVLLPQGIFFLDAQAKAILKHANTPLPPYVAHRLLQDPALTVQLSEAVSQWVSQLTQEPLPLDGLPAYLRPYQKQGVEWLHSRYLLGCGSLLADEMGLGKTLQVLNLVYRFPESSHLVVCPASTVPVWIQESKKFFPEKPPVRVVGMDGIPCADGSLWVSSYAMLRRHAESIQKVPFGFIVLDEAQSIKNPQTQAAQVCYGLQAKGRIAITGTPIENHLLDLWSIFHFLMPDLLGGAEAFVQKNESAHSWKQHGKNLIAPFLLRRTKVQVTPELPGKMASVLLCPLTPQQRAEYQAIGKNALQALGNDLRQLAPKQYLPFLTVLMRLRQVCCDLSLLPWRSSDEGESGKIPVLLESLKECFENGHKVVIFSQFVSFMERIQTALKKQFPEVPCFVLTGQTIDRQAPVAQYQAHSAPCVFLSSLRAGGTGITLHSADTVFLVDPWWNPAVEEQAIDRVHRIGQSKPVFIYRLIAPYSIEEKIQRLKEAKKSLADTTLEGLTHAFLQNSTALADLLLLPEGEESE